MAKPAAGDQRRVRARPRPPPLVPVLACMLLVGIALFPWIVDYPASAAGWSLLVAAVCAACWLAHVAGRRHVAPQGGRAPANYRQLAEDTPGLEALVDIEGRLLWVNNAFHDITGYTLEECAPAGRMVDLCVAPADRRRAHVMALRALQGRPNTGHELRIRHRNGSEAWFTCRWYALRDARGRLTGVRLSGQNVQHRRDIEARLRETVSALREAQVLTDLYLRQSDDERARLAALLDTVTLGIVFIDRERHVLYINPAARAMWGIADQASTAGMDAGTLLECTASLRANDADYRRHLAEILEQRGASEPYDIDMNDGRVLREVSSMVMTRDDATAIGRLWVHEDVTAMRCAQQRLVDMAERDPLTNLLNRRRFVEELDRQLADSQRRSLQVGLIFFDLDAFKHVNDTLGHHIGDALLCAVAAGVADIVRRNELFFRLGGDEFAILVADTDEESMLLLAQRVLCTIAELAPPGIGHTCRVSASLGIAIAPQHAHDSHTLMAAADRAMYVAKSRGKNCCEVASAYPQQEP
ncbi:diguanylate cyclase domain-containing protein [Uliginosibacterium sp. sgz301328]|uniref:sensor domain-containing protein n=1 Tax=Uliginosibacterium sp. sgz301328 TaxID=3243764 RepID=UPI00359E8025